MKVYLEYEDFKNHIVSELTEKGIHGLMMPTEIAPFGYNETVAQDNKCLLGQWIYGEGKKLEVHEEYSKLKREHARFHKAAADVIKKADSGANVTEDVAIGTKSEFGEASVAVIVAINEIKRKVSK